jgi:hypothetical protein
MQLLGDDDTDAGTHGAVRRPPTSTAHQTTYIPHSTHDELHYVRHCSSDLGLLLTIFRALGIHACNTMGLRMCFLWKTSLPVPSAYFNDFHSNALLFLHQPPALDAGFTNYLYTYIL